MAGTYQAIATKLGSSLACQYEYEPGNWVGSSTASQWNDSSGNSNHVAAPTSGEEPTINAVSSSFRGSPSLTFTGTTTDSTSDKLQKTTGFSLSAPGTTPIYMRTVLRRVSAGAPTAYPIVNLRTGRGFSQVLYGTLITASADGGPHNNITALAAGVPFVFESYFSASTSDYNYLNTTQSTGGSFGNNAPSLIRIGAEAGLLENVTWEIVTTACFTGGAPSAGLRAAWADRDAVEFGVSVASLPVDIIATPYWRQARSMFARYRR